MAGNCPPHRLWRRGRPCYRERVRFSSEAFPCPFPVPARPAARRERFARRPAARPARKPARALPGAKLPIPVAGRPARLVVFRDGDPDPRLVRAGQDRVGAAANAVRLAAVPRHVAVAHVRGGGRPAGPAHHAVHHAGLLCRAGRHPNDFGARRGAAARARVSDRLPLGPGASLRPRDAQRARGRHHAGRQPDGCARPVTHDHGQRTHLRRAGRRQPLRRIRHRACLYRRRDLLRAELPADARGQPGAPARRGRAGLRQAARDADRARAGASCATGCPMSGTHPRCCA